MTEIRELWAVHSRLFQPHWKVMSMSGYLDLGSYSRMEGIPIDNNCDGCVVYCIGEFDFHVGRNHRNKMALNSCNLRPIPTTISRTNDIFTSNGSHFPRDVENRLALRVRQHWGGTRLSERGIIVAVRANYIPFLSRILFILPLRRKTSIPLVSTIEESSPLQLIALPSILSVTSWFQMYGVKTPRGSTRASSGCCLVLEVELALPMLKDRCSVVTSWSPFICLMALISGIMRPVLNRLIVVLYSTVVRGKNCLETLYTKLLSPLQPPQQGSRSVAWCASLSAPTQYCSIRGTVRWCLKYSTLISQFFDHFINQ